MTCRGTGKNPFEPPPFHGGKLLGMGTRDELHLLLDRIPENELESARLLLNGLLRPRPALSPDAERARERTHQYKKMVERRFRETRKPGTISALVGGGSVFPKDGQAYGRHGFHYWDDKALVNQTLQIFEGQELEIMERISRSEDGATLVYEQELSSGGLTIRREERFPFCNAEVG